MVSLRTIRWIVLIAAGIMSIIFTSYLIYTKLTLPFDLILWMAIVSGFLVGSIIVYFIVMALIAMRAVAKPADYPDILKKIIVAMHKNGMRINADMDEYGNIFHIPSYDILKPIGNIMYWRFDDEDPQLGSIKRNIFFDMKNNVLDGEIKADELNTRPSKAIEAARIIIEQSRPQEKFSII